MTYKVITLRTGKKSKVFAQKYSDLLSYKFYIVTGPLSQVFIVSP